MSKIYAFCGLSGSGKSTVANLISDLLDLPFVISYTTRPIRPGEENGKDYHFIDNEQWDLLNESFIAPQEFNVACGSVWKYGILQDDLKDDCIAVLTPKGINDLKECGYSVTSIYIDIDETIRSERIISRNDNQSKEEIKRR